MTTPDTSPDFFERMFTASADPWQFATNPYEQQRYSRILQAVGPGPYRHAFEPGCSVGVLTHLLASVCEQVDACDIATTAVATAHRRCSHLPGVTVRRASLRDNHRLADYDLVVLSEVGYYFTLPEWRSLAHALVDALTPGTVVLASHWLGHSPDHLLSGDEVHEAMVHTSLQHELGERHPHAAHAGFRLDRWRKLP